MQVAKIITTLFAKEENGIYSKINLRAVIYLLVLFLFMGKQLYAFWNYLDISFFDESEYLRKGIHLREVVFSDWGPSYNLWYYFLNLFINDATKVFYLNYAVLVFSIPTLLYLLLIRFSIRAELALLFCLSLGMHDLLLNNFTYVSHFCTFIILLVFLISTFIRNNEIKLVVIFTGFYCCMYARQEFLLCFATLFVFWLAFVIYNKKIKLHLAYVVFAIATVVLYQIFGGLNFKAQGMDRSYFAFIQHFYMNYILWNKKAVTPEVLNKLDVFHDATTMFQCMLNNPMMFLKHVSTNIINYILYITLHIEKLVLPSPVFRYLGKLKHVLFVFYVGLFFYILIKKKAGTAIKSFASDHTLIFLLILISFAWSFFSIFFIFPEKHYIVIQISWWIFVMALILHKHTYILSNKFVFIPILLMLACLIPLAKDVNYYERAEADHNKQPNLKTIHYLIKNNSQKPEVILSTEKGFISFLPNNYKEKFTPDKDIDEYRNGTHLLLQKYLDDCGITLIFMNEKMLQMLELYGGNEGKALLRQPEQFGFRKVVSDSTLKTYLLYKTQQ